MASDRYRINDEVKADIDKINGARELLEEARRLLSPSELDDSRMRGRTRTALEELFERAYKELGSRGEECEQVRNDIDRTAKEYRRRDEERAAGLRAR